MAKRHLPETMLLESNEATQIPKPTYKETRISSGFLSDIQLEGRMVSNSWIIGRIDGGKRVVVADNANRLNETCMPQVDKVCWQNACLQI